MLGLFQKRCTLVAFVSAVFFGFLPAPCFAAQTRFPENQTPEEKYWKKAHEKEARKAAAEERHEASRRDDVKAALPEVIRQGEAIQGQIIAAEEALKPPIQPSILKENGEYIVFGLVGTLLVTLTGLVLVRHRREAEIRALSGGYLSDGTEVAKFKMPELFAPTGIGEKPLSSLAGPEETQDAPASDPREAFFAAFPVYLAEMREALQELGRTKDDGRKQKLLADMGELIAAFKVEANLWQLRPIMQVSTVLELLLQRLAEKTKDATPSALRTIAGALDLLADLAVPDLRPDLLVMPPLQILAVDDEPLCLRAVAFALHKANLTPDLARNGHEAVSLAKTKAYDVVFMDIQMPEMDGFGATKEIHQTTFNANTPVVFVTAQSDFQTRAQSNLIGGRDFMAKPFLIFELTVKAVTYAARKRLRPNEAPVRASALPPAAPTPSASAAPTDHSSDKKEPELAVPA